MGALQSQNPYWGLLGSHIKTTTARSCLTLGNLTPKPETFAYCEKPSSGRTKPSAELIFAAHSCFCTVDYEVLRQWRNCGCFLFLRHVFAGCRTVLFAYCEKPSSGRAKPSAELLFAAHSLFLDCRLPSTQMVEKLRLLRVLEAH